MTAPDTDLQLLLSDAEGQAPVLAGGLPESALIGVQAPERTPRGQDSMHLEALDRDPNDLAAQRWAVIAAAGARGDAAIEAVRELIAHRHAQQGAAPTIFRVPADMDAAASLRWKHEVLRDEDVAVDERPRYLLILGDLDEVSLELQHTVANGSLVGRLHCPTLAGYRNYAEKVVTRERGATAGRARSLFYTVQDGSAAIGVGYRHLVEPCMRMTGDLATRGKLELAAQAEIPYSEWGPDDLLAATGVDTPSMMLSLSHGLGAPRRGWRSSDQQRALQGALAMGGDGPLSADMVRESRFLPGGVWLCVACFGAGTPSTSAFYPWLSLLAAQGGAQAQAQAVLQALPRPGERPFVAALPQALLANPSGPLAVIGHMDLAWTFGFTDPTGKQSRASRVFAVLRAVLAGSRVGVGLDTLMHAYRETNDDLMARYQLQRDAAARGQADPVAPRLLGDLWMQRNDLRGYVLLGDPAARLAIAGEPAAVLPRPQPTAIEVPTGEVLSAQSAAPAIVLTSEAPPPESSAPAIVLTSEAPAPRVAPPPESSAPAIVLTLEAPAPRVAPPPPAPANPTPTTPAEVPMSTSQAPPSAAPESVPAYPPQAQPPAHGPYPAPPPGAAPLAALTRPRTLDNPEIGLRERAVLAMIRGDEAPRSIAVRFGLALEEIFYWLDVYREAGRRALGG